MSRYKEYENVPNADVAQAHEEEESLLPSSSSTRLPSISAAKIIRETPSSLRSKRKRECISTTSSLLAAFVVGATSVLFVQNLFTSSSTTCTASTPPKFSHPNPFQGIANHPNKAPSFPGDIGSTIVHDYPPTSPTNAIPSLFPTEIGFEGATKTGAEPALATSAPNYPVWDGFTGLVRPDTWESEGHPSWIEDADENGIYEEFDIFKNWGNLSPFYAVPADSFGMHASTSPKVPNSCTLKGVHVIHRHGARYPVGEPKYGSPGDFATRLHSAVQASSSSIKAHGKLAFLNSWNYKLGTELLTHFGRQQLFDLGISMRMKYGSLLERFTEKLPVFRTGSEYRMLDSATNFAFGFFGWPLDGKVLLEVTVEAGGYNNTIVPNNVCPGSWDPKKSDRETWYLEKWTNVYLKDARHRIQKLLKGYQFTIEDLYAMQNICAFEAVALGYSDFCPLFTKEEWEGFGYTLDLWFWYNSGFGSPVAKALGTGYLLELLSRLTQKPINSDPPLTNNPSTFAVNLTLANNPITFPLDQSIYVDATHDTVIVNILTALNLTFLAKDGPLRADKMKRGRSWVSARLAPFASNMQFQLLSCPDSSTGSSTSSADHIRFILNDAVVSLTGIEDCSYQVDGLCPLDDFKRGIKKLIEASDWDWACHGDWSVPAGDAWKTVTGEPPAKPV